ncbi:rRNA maturation RNase YbeY [Vagococcus penaei]|uniref:Endoribonuclease YbeY n=1 Tax=Vagococcus penaei TaxID=633807 RepID=A0A1Q2D3J2_9ENTE|nr:rRNA maturation RNase YbeY [Vagococcus penaei]AQP52940.1 rRNA maturation RNase YbeY [Vagococcus penaei]RSU02603.1 rRNA maturation RNase YbeY [Vagococcus penaei]
MEITLIDESAYLTDEQHQLVLNLLDFASKQPELNLAEDTEMSVTFVDNAAIQEINRTYREKDMPTDVISFAIEDETDDELAIEWDDFDIPRNIGDIIVSFDKIVEQATEYKHSFERELGFLVVHGFLHLNGYDHLTEDEEKEMFDLQRKILAEYGLKR